LLPGSFVLFNPLDVVSGDFLWYGHTETGLTLVAAVDCTGHGVPGALMSMIGHQLLDQALKLRTYSDPGQILTELHRDIRRLFRKKQGDDPNRRNAVTDGMDVALCAIDREGGTISFSGARRPLYISGAKGVRMLEGSKFTIGAEDRMQVDPQLKTTTVQYTPGTCVYLTTDGYYDQFGGTEDSKMLKKRFVKQLTEVHALPMPEQKEHLDAYFQKWKGDARQTDDVLVVGIRL